jgi:hypothetical protein
MTNNNLNNVKREENIEIFSLLDTLKEMYWAFTPTTKKTKEKFLNQVREKVNYYQPMIEQKCGVSLGDVKVKDNKKWLSDTVYGDAPRLAVEYAWNNGRTPTELDYNLFFIIASVGEAVMLPPLCLFNSLLGADFRHNNDTIYVPFNYMNRFMDFNFKRRTRDMDYGVVHELSHGLWDKLSRNELFEERGNLKEFGEKRKWFEGFATYCAEDYFAEFYPESTKTDYNTPKLYKEGKEKIKEAVDKYGEEIILKIPRVWRELAREN